MPAAGLITAALGTLLVFPAFRLRGHYIAIATLGDRRDREPRHSQLGGPDRRRDGPDRHSSAVLLRPRVDSNRAIYWICLAVLIAIACLADAAPQLASRPNLARRARGRDRGAVLWREPRSLQGARLRLRRLRRGRRGAITAHLYSYLNNQTFDSQLSLLALTMVMLGGMGNVLGAIVGAVALVGLPELFRVAAEYRILIYGVVLLLLVRFRPQGLMGTV